MTEESGQDIDAGDTDLFGLNVDKMIKGVIFASSDYF